MAAALSPTRPEPPRRPEGPRRAALACSAPAVASGSSPPSPARGPPRAQPPEWAWGLRVLPWGREKGGWGAAGRSPLGFWELLLRGGPGPEGAGGGGGGRGWGRAGGGQRLPGAEEQPVALLCSGRRLSGRGLQGRPFSAQLPPARRSPAAALGPAPSWLAGCVAGWGCLWRGSSSCLAGGPSPCAGHLEAASVAAVPAGAAAGGAMASRRAQ